MKNKVNRFERKWLFRSNNYLALINSLIRSKLFFRTQFPLRKVNSIYFDTYDYNSIRENLDGVSNKKKIRIRWYGDKNITKNPIIETKSKKGFETKKESMPIRELNDLKVFSLKNLKILKETINSKLKQKKII